MEWVQGDRKLGRAEIQFGFGCGDRGVCSNKSQPVVSIGVVKLVYDLRAQREFSYKQFSGSCLLCVLLWVLLCMLLCVVLSSILLSTVLSFVFY